MISKVLEGLKPWEFPNNKLVFGAEVSYIAPLPLEESATEMLLWGQSSPEPQGWGAILGATSLQFSLLRAQTSALNPAPKQVPPEALLEPWKTTDLSVLEWPSNRCQPLLCILL